jgi:DnaJ-class molecular chaperone
MAYVTAIMQGKQAADESRAREVQMKKSSAKPAEQRCPACNGTGFPAVKQPTQPGRKIYPVECKTCGGKGRIAGAAN